MRIIMLIFSIFIYYSIWILQVKTIMKVFGFKRRFLMFSIFLTIGILPLFCVIDYVYRGIGFVEFLASVGYLLLGFFIYYVISLGVIFLLRKIVFFIKKSKKEIVNRIVIFSAVLMSIIICLWGILVTQFPEYTYQNLDIGLKEHLKITVVSDIHYGATGSMVSLKRMVDNVNKIEADLILLVGDVFDNDIHNLDHTYFAEVMNQLSASYGVYAITGNHEFMKNNLEQIKSFYEGTNIHLLLDEEVIINDIVCIAGRIDYRGGRKPLEEILTDSNLPLIVLDHQPQFFRDAKELASLQISGHTHNGQIFPGDILIFFLNLLVFQSPSDGIHSYNDFTLAITRGYGTWGIPMRLTGPSQIMIFEL